MLNTKSLYPIIIASMITACGGGGSSDTPEPPAPPPPVAMNTPTNTSGVITGFGSVYINGIKYETTSTEFSTDDNEQSSESELEVGMIVQLEGEIEESGETGIASKIHYEAEIEGPLASIDLATNTLTVLGQQITFDDLTSLDGVIIEELSIGDFLEISGFFDSEGVLYATRIEKETEADEFQIKGIVSSLNTQAQTFMLEALTIDYSSAEFDGFTEGDLADGQYVKVEGESTSLNGNTLVIDEIELKDEDFEHEDGDAHHIEGFITSVESSTSFYIDEVNILTDENTEYENGSADSIIENARVKVKGVYNSDGQLYAAEIRFHIDSDIEVEGEVQAVSLDDSSVTVFGVTFIVNDHTKLKDESGNEERFFELADLSVGDFVEVNGFVNNDGVNIATKLTRENESPDNEMELSGIVSEINELTFVVMGVTVHSNVETEFEGLNGEDVSQEVFFSQLQLGMLIEAEGHIVNDEFIADEVEIEQADDSDDGDSTEFRGVIEHLSDPTLVVSGKEVVVSSMTEFELNDEDITSEQFWNLAIVDDQVLVEGDVDAHGVIQAETIILEINHQAGVAHVILWGAISYDGNMLVVHEHQVEFGVQTVFENLEDDINREQFLEDVANWQQAKVIGVFREHIIEASEITQMEDDENSGEIELTGFVESVLDNGVLLGGHQAFFNDATKYYIDDASVSFEVFSNHLNSGVEVELEGSLSFETASDGTAQEVISIKEIEID